MNPNLVGKNRIIHNHFEKGLILNKCELSFSNINSDNNYKNKFNKYNTLKQARKYII